MLLQLIFLSDLEIFVSSPFLLFLQSIWRFFILLVYLVISFGHPFKMESTLFVLAKLTFSENLRCLNLPRLVGTISQKRLLSKACFIFAGQSVHSGKFIYHKYFEIVNFAGTKSVDSILVIFLFLPASLLSSSSCYFSCFVLALVAF